MSEWTSVKGFIEIKKYNTARESTDKLKNIIGKIQNYNSKDYNPKDTKIPCGSEGSLNYVINQPLKLNSFIWAYITIFGNLRDFDIKEFNTIKYWLNCIKDGVLNDEKYIGDVLLEINFPTETYLVQYDKESEEFIYSIL